MSVVVFSDKSIPAEREYLIRAKLASTFFIDIVLRIIDRGVGLPIKT
jgi:hypothetical protein